MATSDHEELARVRERVHDHATLIQRTLVRIDALESRIDRQTARCNAVEETVDALVVNDRIAEAVTTRLKRERAALFSIPAKIAAFTVSVCAIASFVLQLVPH